MNLQDYIEQIKGWVGRQCFLIRHYRIAIFIFLILALAMIVAGIFYPHEEEHININSAQSEGSVDNQRRADTKAQSQGRSNKKRNDKENGFDFQHNNSLNYRYCITNFQKQTVFLDIIHNIIKKRK